MPKTKVQPEAKTEQPALVTMQEPGDDDGYPVPVAVTHQDEQIPLDQVEDGQPLPSKPQELSLSTIKDVARDDFIRQINERRNRPEPAYVPPQMTERQMTQREAEMARGRERQAFHEAQEKHRPPRKPDPAEGKTTQVFRPRDHVPAMHQGNLGARSVRED